MITIKRAVSADASDLREVAIEANIDAWPVADYEAEIHRIDSVVLCAREGNTIVGFVLTRIVPGVAETKDADLYNIAVRDSSKRKGIGRQLLDELTARLKKKGVVNVWLEVRESNLSAIRFYESLCFFAELTRPDFYANPTENAVIMRLVLS